MADSKPVSAPGGTNAVSVPEALAGSMKRALAPLIASFLFVVAVIAATAWLAVAQGQSDEELRRLIGIRADFAGLLSALQDAETGQRGYLLTDDKSYLAPYEAAIESIPGRLDRLATALDGEPEVREGLVAMREVAAAKLAELAETIEQRRAGRGEAALARVRDNSGKALMDRLRVLHGSTDIQVRERILEMRRRAVGIAIAVQIGIAVATLLLVGLAAYVLADARRRNARLLRAYEDLRESNNALAAANLNRDRLEAQLRQAQKMEAMGQLTGGLAHDFNNMLAVIVGNLGMLKRRIEQGARGLERYTDQALEGAARAATLTHRLLAFARKQPLAPETIESNRLVAGMSELLRRTLGETVRIETVLAGGLWRTRADPHQLESALLNLAINARDAMPSGGRLTIETANAHIDEAYAREHVDIAPGQYVMIAVTDTGTGMSPEVAAKAFEPFFTTKEVGKGTGLGLSQVFGFVKQSDGHVKIYSEPGTGTSIKIYLPRLRGGDAPAVRTRVGLADAVPVGNATEIVLVVEDEPAVRRLTVEALRDLNYTVIHAETGALALALMDVHPQIALLLTDVVMPEMNGRQLADAARVRRPELKVLYATGYTRNAIVHNGVIDEGVMMIGKPFTLEQLAHKVREAIAR